MSDCTKGCDDSCNSDCGCGSTHHHCGCPCHVPPSLDEQHQHAERMATKWLARYQELSAEVGRVPGTCEPTLQGWRVGDLLTVEQWGALNSLLTALANDEPRSVALNDRTTPLVASAISKLFAINAGHVVCGYCKPKWGVFDTHAEKS